MTRERADRAQGARAEATRQATSAGGVIYRRGGHGIEVVLVGRPSQGLWALPKGTPEPGESHEQTAVREVTEETGLAVRLVEALGTVQYRFQDADGVIVDKIVYHFLFAPTGGHPAAHDGEHEIVGWFDIHEAERLLTHRNQMHILRNAAEIVDRMPQ
ncbi:MAG: NUDIX domain-containing protein [Chloroflexi bacterium]|nr:NUDIX domain-containing protein [Chloroflexota bacterium]